MSLREKQQQMKLDTETATHTSMEGQPRCSYKYQLLQVWCGLLTVAMVVMAVRLASVTTKPMEAGVTTQRNDSPTTGNTTSPKDRQIQEPLKLGTSPSFIQLYKHLHPPLASAWKKLEPPCNPCSFTLHEDSIYFNKTSFYFLYAQVTFRNKPNKTKSVIVRRNELPGKRVKTLVEGTYSNLEGSLWVAKIVKLTKGDSVSIEITDEIINDQTHWGAIELH